MPIVYTCSKCNAQTPKWQGRCGECGNWGTLDKETIDKAKKIKEKIDVKPGEVIDFSDIKEEAEKRVKTNIQEFDRVLGGGIVPGSLVLIGGEPGIGKSTLVLQTAGAIDNTLYVSGEESAGQIKIRLNRLNIKGDNIKFSSETEIEKICATAKNLKPNLVIVDSIQTISSLEIVSETGSVSQIKAVTVKLLGLAKKTNIPIFIIGHITKDGSVAGPKTLEHLVDTVAYLEGDEKNDLRILRAKKNRFGATSEIGIFEMKNNGLEEVKNPAGIFLETEAINTPGMAVGSILEGTRTFLVEVQALANKTFFNYPERRAFGFNLNRLQILSAVLMRRANINLTNIDLNINIVGGIKATEPALDLAVCMSIVSAYKNKPLSNDLAIIGEVGLGGEIRKVNKLDQRILEAKKLGFKNILLPNFTPQKNLAGVNLIKIRTLSEAIEKIF
ncbi:DNA repair protein RadA [Candidatus Falkowbacteria bacterium]|jgi:DNA repair protein RadA/Sms|nr:DNA repair protein RadA [Elusimicrobiaceae bacterium]MBT4433527.1 DNA repair protein RadA [Candidatus Falkowbacteria bacterium]